MERYVIKASVWLAVVGTLLSFSRALSLSHSATSELSTTLTHHLAMTDASTSTRCDLPSRTAVEKVSLPVQLCRCLRPPLDSSQAPCFKGWRDP
jgi:hypothetical protein